MCINVNSCLKTGKVISSMYYSKLYHVDLLQSTQWKSQTKENKLGSPFSHDSAYGIGNFSAFKSTAKAVGSQNSVKEVWHVHFFFFLSFSTFGLFLIRIAPRH